MTWQWNAYLLAPVAATLLSAGLLVLVARHRGDELANAFVALMAAIGLWSAVYTVQLGQATRGGKLPWLRVSIAIAGFVPTLWLLFTSRYANRTEWLSRPVRVLLAAEPVAFAAFVVTDPVHHLVWTGASLVGEPPWALLDVALGPVYLVHIAYAYLLVLVGVGQIVGVAVDGSRPYRRQAGLLLVGSVPPLGANVLFTAGYGPLPNVDLTTFTFTLTGVVFFLAVFRYEILDLTPVARSAIIEESGTGYLVLDGDRTVVDVNGVARRVLSPTPAVGDAFGAIFDADLATLDGTVVTAEVDGVPRYFSFATAALPDRAGERVGTVITMLDSTALREHEQRLEVANRALRHNLRNDMNVIVGHAETLAASLEGEEAAAARAIAAQAAEVADLGEKAAYIERTLDRRDDDHEAVDLVAAVETAVAAVADDHPTAEIEVRTDGPVAAAAIGADLLGVALRNLIENAVEHNDSSPPAARVEVGTDGDDAVVTVADDGPGIPAVETAVLSAGEETALEHGSGLGLWLVHWAVTRSGGSLSFEENDPRGSRVRMRLPRAESTG